MKELKIGCGNPTGAKVGQGVEEMTEREKEMKGKEVHDENEHSRSKQIVRKSQKGAGKHPFGGCTQSSAKRRGVAFLGRGFHLSFGLRNDRFSECRTIEG
jgi:hypothetical protein